MSLILHPCPSCGAGQGEPCRTPKGRKKHNVHDIRPFSVLRPAQEFEKDAREYLGRANPVWPRSDLRWSMWFVAKQEVENELDMRFMVFKQELAAMGYEFLFVNTHDFNGGSLQGPDHVVAWPKRTLRDYMGCALWRAEALSHGCGNGLKDADQMQLRFPLPAKFWGKHDLCSPSL